MAGITIDQLQEILKTEKVVRTLPNLALKIGKSATVWMAAGSLAEDEKELARSILQRFGMEIELVDEEMITKIGVLSGCGPAYFALMSEKMAKIAVEMGLEDERARRMAEMVFIGSGEMLEMEGISAEEFRKRISSKGGITEVAVNKMEEEGFEDLMRKAADAGIEQTNKMKEENGS